MQKRDRNEWKKIVTSVKEVLGVEYRTRDIHNTKELQQCIKEMAFIYARENRNKDTVAVSEEVFLKAQIRELKQEVFKYKRMYEDVTKSNNILITQYEKQKKKVWQFWK